MKLATGVFATFLILFAAFDGAWAQSNRAVLPEGVWHPMIRYGLIYEVSNHFDNSGSLQSVGRLNQAFNGETISRSVPKFSKMYKLLNNTFPNSNYANKLSVGALEFEADAQVQYWAPVLARGISRRWTLGLGVPIVNLKATVNAYQTGTNNVRAIRNQISVNETGTIDPNLEQGFNDLEKADLVKSYEQALTEKGYIIPRSVDRTVVGDLQMVSVYQYFETKRWVFYNQTTANLPTGPEDNPDDFLDVPVFHRSSIKSDFHQDYRITKKWNVGTNMSYTWQIPDHALKRVPSDEFDVLPDSSRKENVNRDLGDIWTAGGMTNYWFSNYFNVAGNYEYSYKGEDSYSGSRGYDYHLLARDSESSWHRAGVILTFSTLDWFFSNDFAVPFIVTYSFSDTISGVNVDRQLWHEFAFKMFF